MVDLSSIQPSSNRPNQISERSVSKTSSNRAKESSSTPSTSTDRIEISAGAREAGVLNRLVKSAQSEPDVRVDAVEQARQRLANGEYEGVEVSRETAKKILGFV
ncbi:MAG: hypothetical protein GC154_02815 [bacterium]|nr:hypothetical protein [bacterium]